jgi:hypothetical protein
MMAWDGLLLGYDHFLLLDVKYTLGSQRNVSQLS